MDEGDVEGLPLVVAPDVTLQTVLAAEGLLTAVAGAVEWPLPYRASRDKEGQNAEGDREVSASSYSSIMKRQQRLKKIKKGATSLKKNIPKKSDYEQLQQPNKVSATFNSLF